MSRYRITSGHPIFPHWVEDALQGYDHVAYFSTYEAAEEWIAKQRTPLVYQGGHKFRAADPVDGTDSGGHER